MKNALVSIIITCYNQAHCIAQTIESVKAQTYKQWECIIVDDGSKDTSAWVIQETIGKDLRFKYVFQDNQGVAKARNLGFAMAKGELINFLDGDDTFLPLKIELQTECFEENRDLYICICDHQYYHVQTNNYKYHKFEPIKIKPLEQQLFLQFHKSNISN